MLKSRSTIGGFTMVELGVVLAIVAVLAAIAVPSFSAFMANSSLKTAAESFYSAVQKARAEAIRLNTIVDLVLTNDTPAGVVTAVSGGQKILVIPQIAENTNGTNWFIRLPNADGTGTLVESKLATEGGGANITVNGGGVTKIQFNGLGETTNAATVLVQFKHATQNTSCSLSSAVRCLNVRISAGGQARLCEPNQPTTDTRAC
jgi:type IV fimbrial biogenesis protein FimT